MEEIASAITNYGFSAILLAWMIFKDYKFNENILAVLGKMETLLTKLETWHNAEEGQK
jgi:ABC-type glucose/galactose transport system permease subunit